MGSNYEYKIYGSGKRSLVASILRRAAESLRGEGNVRWNVLQDMADLIGRCGNDEYVEKLKNERRFCCCQRGCPSCLTQRVAIPKRAIIIANFMGVPEEDRWALRFSLSRGRVPGERLKETKKVLEYAVRRLTQSALWLKTFGMWAGCFHPEWKKRSMKNGAAGFWTHLHLICEGIREIDDEVIARIAAKYEAILELPDEFKTSAVFDMDRVESLDGYGVYMPHVENLVPGYKPDQRGDLRLESMPPIEILHFFDATKGMRRLVSHGLNRAITEAALADPKDFLQLRKWGFR